jgi:hypothetical protein
MFTVIGAQLKRNCRAVGGSVVIVARGYLPVNLSSHRSKLLNLFNGADGNYSMSWCVTCNGPINNLPLSNAEYVR